jgi:hypothetical protein
MKGDPVRRRGLAEELLSFARERRPLPGVGSSVALDVFAGQLVESTHRVRYPSVIQTRDLSPRRSDPEDAMFDPLLAAELARRAGDAEEACWLVFLFVHFGKHLAGGWRYARQVYSGMTRGKRWDWPAVSQDPEGFRVWLRRCGDTIKSDPRAGGFGSHRKYQSLDADSNTGTGAAVATYVGWVTSAVTHRGLLGAAVSVAGRDGQMAFDNLYRSMSVVASFGRTARFDYLCMIGKLGLAPIAPGSPYLKGATGPLAGARLLFGGTPSARIQAETADAWVVELGAALGLGMQVMEDALCNWKKSPTAFRAFRG